MHVARTFRKVIRHSDLLGRYGGEEFGIILRRCPPANGRMIAEKLRSTLADNPMALRDGEDITMRVSIGVASFPNSGATATDLCDAADRALYQAKSAGRDRVAMG
jgi:diguanylate cyclase (GGDEF)-like protein